MNEEKINKLLDFLADTLQQTKDFTLEQAPQVYKEILSFDLWEAKYNLILGFSICLSLLIICSYYFKRFLKNKNDPKISKDWHDRENYQIAANACFAGILISLFASGMVFNCNYQTIKEIEIAPKAYLMKKLRILRI